MPDKPASPDHPAACDCWACSAIAEMNVFALPELGMRLVELDENDELYNCTAQLVLAANELWRALDHECQSESCRACRVARALKPFLDR